MKSGSKSGRDVPLPYESLPLVGCGQPFSLLSGVTVLDLTTSIAGPYATMLLSDFGADVIKVERPEGDDARKWGPPFLDGEALWFTAINRNKKSVVLDTRTARGRADLDSLVAGADVFVTNQTLDVQRKLGLDYASLKRLREDIVFVAISGFGLTGPRAELTCYDLIAEGYSGIMDITGAEQSPPQKVGAPAADMLAGQDAAMATMAALYERFRSGKGRQIDISLAESMTRFLTCRISSYLGSGEVPRRSGGTDSVIAIYQPFETADGPMNLGLGSDAIWVRFWKAVGDPTYGSQPRFATNAKRRTHRSEIIGRIQDILRTKPRGQWLELFARTRVPAGPINRVDEVSADPAFHDRHMFFALQGEDGRIVPQIGLGVQIDGRPSVPRSTPPRLGQHTGELLGKLARAGSAAPHTSIK
jgi:crotonobetainyl-CoA:carnitine CoA-transferase CaiB-like acyl-CoA transferase